MSDTGDPGDLLRLDRQLCFPIYAATNLLQRLYRPLLEPLGLTYSQYLVMMLLWERAPVPIGALGECLHLDIGTLSPLLKRMERAGLITRKRDPDDERRVLIGLTPHGQALRVRAADVPAGLARRTGMEPSDAAQLRDLMHGLIGTLVRAVG